MTNEETQYMPNAVQNENTTPSPQPRRGLKTGWKRVAIGGVSGIMVGSAAAYAATHLMDNRVAEKPADDTEGDAAAQAADTKMATTVTDDMTFEDAFAAARDEVGAGGVFTWKGNVYGTFTTDEWEAMTPQEQMDYFAAVSGQEVPEHIAAQPQVQEVHHYHHAVADQPAAQATAQHNEANQGDHFIPNNDTHSTADSDVRIVATSEVEQVGDGTYAQHLEIDGHAAVALGDQQGPDVVVIDINDNRQLDPHDVIIDLQSEQVATVGDVVAQVQAQDPGYVTAGYEEATVDTEPTVDPNLHEVDYDPMDPANDPMLMDDGIDDLGMDMASDVPVYDC